MRDLIQSPAEESSPAALCLVRATPARKLAQKDAPGFVRRGSNVVHSLTLTSFTSCVTIRGMRPLQTARGIETASTRSRAKTVGGAMDVLVIKLEMAFWVQRKEIHA